MKELSQEAQDRVRQIIDEIMKEFKETCKKSPLSFPIDTFIIETMQSIVEKHIENMCLEELRFFTTKYIILECADKTIESFSKYLVEKELQG